MRLGTTNPASVVLQIEFFDTGAEAHEAHLLAFIHLMELIVTASRDLVCGLCGADQNPVIPGDYSKMQRERARALAARNSAAKKILIELGVWSF